MVFCQREMCVALSEVKHISHPQGDIKRFVRSDDIDFVGFGEVYFSEIKYNCLKAWKMHLRMTMNLSVISGIVDFNFIDSRKDSNTYMKKINITL